MRKVYKGNFLDDTILEMVGIILGLIVLYFVVDWLGWI